MKNDINKKLTRKSLND